MHRYQKSHRTSTQNFSDINAIADKPKIVEGCLYDVQYNNVFEDEQLNLICIQVLHKTCSITTTNVLFIVVNSSMEDIHVRKREILGFTELTGINSNDLPTETVYKVIFQDKDPTSDVESDPLNQMRKSKLEMEVNYFSNRY